MARQSAERCVGEVEHNGRVRVTVSCAKSAAAQADRIDAMVAMDHGVYLWNDGKGQFNLFCGEVDIVRMCTVS